MNAAPNQLAAVSTTALVQIATVGDKQEMAVH